MANTLKIGNSTDYIFLSPKSSSTDVDVLEYVPRSEDPATPYVTESCDIFIKAASQALLQARINKIVDVFRIAKEFQSTGIGAVPVVSLQPDGYSTAWTSEIISGTIEFDEKTLNKSSWSRFEAVIRLTWTRRNFWEGARTAVKLSQGSTTDQASCTVYNFNDGRLGGTYFNSVKNYTTIDGDLPAACIIWIRNTYNSTESLDNIFISNNYNSSAEASYSSEYGWYGMYEGEDLTVESGYISLTPTSDSDSSGGEYGEIAWTATGEIALVVIPITATNVRTAGGSNLKIFARLANVLAFDDVYIKTILRIQNTTTTISETGYTLLQSGRCLQELGVLRIPPYDIPNTMYGWGAFEMVLVASKAGAGEYNIDLDYLFLAPIDIHRKLRAIYPLPYGWYVADNSEKRIGNQVGVSYSVDETNEGDIITHTGVGPPMYLYPGKKNQLFFTFDYASGKAPANASLSINMYYTPRRLTL